MNQILQIKVRNVYGNQMFYPANEVAKEFAYLSGTKTLSYNALASAKRLGFTVEQVSDVDLSSILAA